MSGNMVGLVTLDLVSQSAGWFLKGQVFRDDCLNQHWFTYSNEAKEIIDEWRINYYPTFPKLRVV